MSASQEKRSQPYLSYYYYVHVPIGIAAIVVGGHAAGWYGWRIAVVLLVVLWLVVMFAGMIGVVLADRENAREAGTAATPEPPETAS